MTSLCSNKRVIVTRAHDEIKFEEEDNIEVEMPPLADASDECIEYPLDGDVLMVKRALDMHVEVGGLEKQSENIFHTRCHVQNKICSLIIDNNSCTNITSVDLMDKFYLQTTKHHVPYKL